MSWFGSLGGSLGGLLGKASGFLSNPAVNIAAHLTGAGLLTDTINGVNALASKLGGSAGLSDQQKLLALAALQQQNQGQTASTTYAEDAAAQDAIDTAEQEARGNTTSAINSGVSRAKAGMLGEAAANKTLTSDYADRYGQYKGQGASSQADYLKSMGQTYDLGNQLYNANKGASSAIKYGALSGAAQGAGLGMSLSDETAKEPITSNENVPADLNNKISEFINLTKRVYDLKKRRQ